MVDRFRQHAGDDAALLGHAHAGGGAASLDAGRLCGGGGRFKSSHSVSAFGRRSGVFCHPAHVTTSHAASEVHSIVPLRAAYNSVRGGRRPRSGPFIEAPRRLIIFFDLEEYLAHAAAREVTEMCHQQVTGQATATLGRSTRSTVFPPRRPPCATPQIRWSCGRSQPVHERVALDHHAFEFAFAPAAGKDAPCNCASRAASRGVPARRRPCRRATIPKAISSCGCGLCCDGGVAALRRAPSDRTAAPARFRDRPRRRAMRPSRCQARAARRPQRAADRPSASARRGSLRHCRPDAAHRTARPQSPRDRHDVRPHQWAAVAGDDLEIDVIVPRIDRRDHRRRSSLADDGRGIG